MTRILYVDDEPDIREIAELALSLDPEFEVRTVSSGEEALMAAQWQPSLILLDVMMPFMDGPATLARPRGNLATEAIPVAFVTARAQRTEIQDFTSMGAVGVIAKPFDPISLPAQARIAAPGRGASGFGGGRPAPPPRRPAGPRSTMSAPGR